MLITLPIQLGIGQNYHQKKCSFQKLPKNTQIKQYDKHEVQNAWEQIVHLGLGFRWETIAKETKANEFLDQALR